MLGLSRILNSGITFKNAINCRSLFSASALGMDGYIAQREKTIQKFSGYDDKFRTKMSQFVDEKAIVMTEDLKSLIYLAENNENEFELLEKMIRQFNKQTKEVRFGNFIFGPVVMRLLYHFNNIDLALKFFKDPEMEGFFDQLSSYQILADMLYESDRYKDVLDVFHIIRSRKVQGGIYPKYVIVLVYAACYKENTPDSFKFASDLWAELIRNGHIPMRRAAAFAAMLAVKQNAPHIALEIIGTVQKQNYVTVRNIKVLALAELGRADDTLPILRSALEINDPTIIYKHTFTKDVITRLREIVNQSENSELLQKYNKIEKVLIEQGHMTDKTLQDILTSKMSTRSQYNTYGKNEAVLASSYNNNSSNQYQKYGNNFSNRYRRPGLYDLD